MLEELSLQSLWSLHPELLLVTGTASALIAGMVLRMCQRLSGNRIRRLGQRVPLNGRAFLNAHLV